MKQIKPSDSISSNPVSDFPSTPKRHASLLQSAHGKIPYNMTNDYMFRAVLQSNCKVLKGLVCSLLHLSESEVHSVEVTNPIILGEAIKDKEFRLDINVNLHLFPHDKQQNVKLPRKRINFEMQIANQLNWPNRSILYLCRSFDNLNRGYDYSETTPAIHIGFLNYTLFKNQPEFYATYKLINMKNHNIYSDNFVLSVIDLTHIELATDEDKKYQIDSWAALFKAATWEELTMLASKNEYLNETANSIFQFNADEQIRKRCLDREEYYQDLRSYEKAIAERDVQIRELTAKKDAQILELTAEIERLKNLLQ